jgi:molybdopterin molybdotransferase
VITADEALRIVLDNVALLGVERVAILTGLGRVLAEDTRSPRDIPGFDNSAMDGFAVRASDVASASESNPVSLKVIETVGAGTMPTRRVEPGTAVRTMTGAPIADGADAIIQVERTRGSDSKVEILASVEPRGFIRPRGEDLRAGEMVMAAGKVLTASDLGTLASLNRSMLDVYRKPQVAIVATGDELVDVDQIPTGAQIVNSSAYALAAAIAEAGGDPTILKIARDTIQDTRERLSEAMRFDGVMDELGMRTLFHGVAQKPGRPLKFGIMGERPVFGLPGNPVSTMVCFYLYARPALRKMEGHRKLGLARINVTCGADIKVANNLTEFVRVRLERKGSDIFATPTGNQGSGILSSLSRADALLIGPTKENLLKAGSPATALLLDPHAATDEEAFFEAR